LAKKGVARKNFLVEMYAILGLRWPLSELWEMYALVVLATESQLLRHIVSLKYWKSRYIASVQSIL
jgi:hypothetical protein